MNAPLLVAAFTVLLGIFEAQPEGWGLVATRETAAVRMVSVAALPSSRIGAPTEP